MNANPHFSDEIVPRCSIEPPLGVRAVPRRSIKVGRVVTAFCLDQKRIPYNVVKITCHEENSIQTSGTSYSR